VGGAARYFFHIVVPLFSSVKLLFSNNLTHALISHSSENSAHNLDVQSASSFRTKEISLVGCVHRLMQRPETPHF
jgi:hypothetical protein